MRLGRRLSTGIAEDPPRLEQQRAERTPAETPEPRRETRPEPAAATAER